MGKTVCIMMLLAFCLSGCTTHPAQASDNELASSYAVATAESCSFTFDFDDPYALEDTTVYENELGQRIRLTRVENVDDMDATLYFAADFAETEDGTTLLSACVPAATEDGGMGFFCASLSAEPAELFSARYGMRTTELTDTGNEFTVLIYASDPDAFALSTVREATVSLTDLPLLIFTPDT